MLELDEIPGRSQSEGKEKGREMNGMEQKEKKIMRVQSAPISV